MKDEKNLRQKKGIMYIDSSKAGVKFRTKGRYLYDVRNIFGSLDPSPSLVPYINQLIVFLSSAFWGPPFPHPVRRSYKYRPQVAGRAQRRIPGRPEDVRPSAAERRRRNRRNRVRVHPALPGTLFSAVVRFTLQRILATNDTGRDWQRCHYQPCS